MTTTILAAILAALIAYKWGERKAYANARALLMAIASGRIRFNEEGYLEQVEDPGAEQRKVAHLQ